MDTVGEGKGEAGPPPRWRGVRGGACVVGVHGGCTRRVCTVGCAWQAGDRASGCHSATAWLTQSMQCHTGRVPRRADNDLQRNRA